MPILYIRCILRQGLNETCLPWTLLLPTLPRQEVLAGMYIHHPGVFLQPALSPLPQQRTGSETSSAHGLLHGLEQMEMCRATAAKAWVRPVSYDFGIRCHLIVEPEERHVSELFEEVVADRTGKALPFGRIDALSQGQIIFLDELVFKVVSGPLLYMRSGSAPQTASMR